MRQRCSGTRDDGPKDGSSGLDLGGDGGADRVYFCRESNRLCELPGRRLVMDIQDFMMQVFANAPAMGVVVFFLHYRIKKVEAKVEEHNKFSSRLAVLEIIALGRRSGVDVVRTDRKA